MMRCATAYRRKGAIYLDPESRTPTDLWIGGGPVRKVQCADPRGVKGEAVLEALLASRDSVPHPKEVDAVVRPLLKAAGVKSWRAFARDACACGVEAEGDCLRFIPHRRLGSSATFVPIAEKAFAVSVSSPPDKIGAALDDALESCEG